MEALDRYIDQVDTLPPAPRVLPELLVLLRQDDIDSEAVVSRIEFDPGLTAKLLQRCNSAALGLAQPVHDAREAVLCLGFNEVFRIVATIMAETALAGSQQGYGISPGELLQHSAVTAVAARTVAGRLGDNENVVFTAALLHDIGKVVLSGFLENRYAALVKEIDESGHSFVEAERILLGVEHSEIGGRILSRWNFPENLVRAVWHHHDPAVASEFERLASCVYLADVLAHCLGYGHGHQPFAVRGRGEAFSILGVKPDEIDTLVLQTDRALRKTAWLPGAA